MSVDERPMGTCEWPDESVGPWGECGRPATRLLIGYAGVEIALCDAHAAEYEEG